MNLSAATAYAREWRDNLLDATTLRQYYGGVANGNNAYRSCARQLTPAGSGNLTLTALSYASDTWKRRWYATATPTLVNAGSRSAGVVSPPPPSLTLRFVQFSQPAANGWGCFSQTDWYAFTAQDVRDCQFLNAWNQFWGPWAVANTIEVRNNLFQRSPASFVGCQTLDLYNNLFWGGSNYFKSHQVGFWTIRDNAFHDTVLRDDSAAGWVSNGHNAYLGAGQAQLQNSSGNDVVTTTFDYATGPYGPWYQASTSLVDRGSQSASSAGLYHETTQADQTQETNSTVDIGFHYVAVDACGQPVDADGEGLADYLEDANGDGVRQLTETDPTNGDTDGDFLSDATEILASGTDPLDPDGNGNGVPDGEEYEAAWNWSPSHPFDYRAWSFESGQTGGVRKTLRLVIPRGVDALHLTVKAMTQEYPDYFAVYNDVLSYSISGPAVAGSAGTFTLTDLNLTQYAWQDLEAPHWHICHEQTKDYASYIELRVTAKDGGDELFYPPIEPRQSVIAILVGGLKVSLEVPLPEQKRVFTSASPGTLPVEFEARVAPADPVSEAYVAGHVRFDMDGVGDSTPGWEHQGGFGLADGERFLNTLTFVNLPTDNSGFGEKRVRLYVDGLWGLDTEWTNRVFYPADVANWPGVPPPDPDHPFAEPFNYFHYYMQTDAAIPSTADGPLWDGTSYTSTVPPYKYYVARAVDRTDAIEIPGVNGGELLKYIDLFAWAARHERAHHRNWAERFWPNGRDAGLDQDMGVGDWLPDAYEPSPTLDAEGGPYDITKLDTYPNGPTDTQPNDCERHNSKSIYAEAWETGSADEDDWAYPGKQWH